MRRRSTGMSVSTSSSSRMSPASGAESPEMMLTSVVLPLPERPNSAMTPGVGAANVASSENPGRFLTTETCNILAAQQAAHAPHQQFGGQQSQQAQPEGQHRKPQRQCVAGGRLHRGIEREGERAGHAGNVG